MKLNKTLSDRELDRQIRHARKNRDLCRSGSLTWEKRQEVLDYLEFQRALPRAERAKYADGSL